MTSSRPACKPAARNPPRRTDTPTRSPSTRRSSPPPAASAPRPRSDQGPSPSRGRQRQPPQRLKRPRAGTRRAHRHRPVVSFRITTTASISLRAVHDNITGRASWQLSAGGWSHRREAPGQQLVSPTGWFLLPACPVWTRHASAWLPQIVEGSHKQIGVSESGDRRGELRSTRGSARRERAATPAAPQNRGWMF